MERERPIYRPVRVSAQMDRALGAEAARQGISKSELMRELVDRGLKEDGALLEDGYLQSIVKDTLQELLSPAVERLAAISAKATQISSAAFFMSMWAGSRNGTPQEWKEAEEAAGKARSLGIQFLKLKDRDLDEFIAEATKQIIHEQDG